MASYFIQWVTLGYWCLISKCWFASGCPFKLTPVSSCPPPRIWPHHSGRMFLLFNTKRHSRLILYFICTSPGLGYFSKEPVPLGGKWDLETKIWARSMLTAILALLLPSPPMACVYAQAYLYIFLHIYWKLWVIPVLPIPTFF